MVSRIEKREFRLGVRILPDLNPSLEPEESLQLHTKDYPEIVNSKLEGPQIIDGAQVYTIKASLGYKG